MAAEACLVSLEVVRLPTLKHTVKIATPAASHLGLRLCMQRNSRPPELTKIEPHPKITPVYALSSQRALSIDLSLSGALPAEHL